MKCMDRQQEKACTGSKLWMPVHPKSGQQAVRNIQSKVGACHQKPRVQEHIMNVCGKHGLVGSVHVNNRGNNGACSIKRKQSYQMQHIPDKFVPNS